jgi:excisionase family DNA binding protein
VPILYCSLINMPTDSTQLAELLTVDEVAELLKISASSVRRLQSDRKIPFVKVRGSVRFVREDIVSYIDRCRVEAIGS